MYLGISEVEEAVFQAHVLAGVGGGGDLKRQHVFALAQNGDVLGVNLDHARCDFFVDRFLVALDNLAAERDGALLVDAPEQRVVVYDHLQHTVLVADIEEHNAAVVADILHPTGNAHLLTDIFFS